MWGITVLTALSPVDGKMGMGRRGGQTASSPTPSQAFCSRMATVAPGSTDLEDVCFLLYSCGGDPLCSCPKPPREISGAMRWLPPFLSGSWYSARLPGEVRVEILIPTSCSNQSQQWSQRTLRRLLSSLVFKIPQGGAHTTSLIVSHQQAHYPTGLWKEGEASWEQNMTCSVVGNAHSQSQGVEQRMGKGSWAILQLWKAWDKLAFWKLCSLSQFKISA